MKTSAKQFTTYGNAAIVQIQAEPKSSLMFRPGAPELSTGGLVITEKTGEGVVGSLRADNLTLSYLLLTDADVLTGAKQNRILNKSILLAPKSSTFLDVSCIERLRWNYNRRDFSNPGTIADPDLRKTKASSIAFRLSSPDASPYETQGKVWEHVSDKLREKKISDNTESYYSYLEEIKASAPAYPQCEPEKGCNGFAIIVDSKVISADLFGNEETYVHYFPYLRDSAFRMAMTGKKIKPVDVHEAYYKSLDLIDRFLAGNRIAETEYSGAGTLHIVEGKDLVGYDLQVEGEMVHNVVFAR